MTFPDVPEAITGGKDRAEALEMAEDALAVALGGYVHMGWDIPIPSNVNSHGECIPVRPIVAAKLALYTAMREQGISSADLSDRLGITESAVCKLLNPDYGSHMTQVMNALKAVGRTLVVEDRAA